jgi:DNA (cytosine-5)-methyltransferase 1
MLRLLDTFCCAGGASMGYHRAGFAVTGVDIVTHPRYPFPFFQRDAVDFIKNHGHKFAAIAASPPCQAYTNAQKIQKNEHPDLIAPTREALLATGKPYVIENVRGAPLIDPVELCGCMFPALNVYRPRLFEMPWYTGPRPEHRTHTERVTKMGRKPQPGERMHVVGNFSGVPEARKAMGIDWMTRDELREAIPPAYTEWIGRRLIEHLGATT